MSLYIDHKYIAQISPRLERFKRKNQKSYNFRCPICGDSEKSKTKARGYFYQKGNDMFFRCHNCGEGSTLANFIKQLDPHLYGQYCLERYSQGETGHSNYEKPKFEFNWNKPSKREDTEVHENPLNSYPTIASLPESHPASEYIRRRLIPEYFHSKLYYVPDFKELVDAFEPEDDHELQSGDSRIVIPFYAPDGRLIAFQGRTLGKSSLRYITIKVDPNAPKIFGLDRLDPNKLFYIVEGPFDSMFLDNAIATAGAPMTLKDLKEIGEDFVFVYDNEKRNKAIVDLMVKMAEKEQAVCVWPATLEEKDINDMILSGKTPAEIMRIITSNTYAGLEARIAIAGWRKL
jgi:transcription elongation factor Elf1